MLISIGTPMLLMGDEMRRTQRGNNNAYCQDNEISWLDWSLLNRHRDLHRFVKTLMAHRLRGIAMRGEESFGLSLNELLRRAEVEWHGVRLGQPDWTDDSHSLACTIRSGPGHLPFQLHLMSNAYWEALEFDLPKVPEKAASGSAGARDAISGDAALRGGAARAHRYPLWGGVRSRGREASAAIGKLIQIIGTG